MKNFTEIGIDLTKLISNLLDFLENNSSYFQKTEFKDIALGPVSRTNDYAELCKIWAKKRNNYLISAKKRPCPCCNYKHFEPLFISQDGYPYVKCDACGMWYVSDYIPDEIWTKYQQQESLVATLHDRQFAYNCSSEYYESDRLRFKSYFDTIKKFIPNNSLAGLRYLDIGCFTGNSLRVAKTYEMEAFGIENSQRVLHYIQNNHVPLNIYLDNKDVTDVFSNKKFDLIGIWETLEHNPDPLQRLLQARNLLEKGSLLALTVPNANSAAPIILKDYCFYCIGGADTQGHINMFSIETLGKLLGTAGFKPVFVETIYSTDWTQIMYYLSGHWSKIFCIKNIMSGSCFQYKNPLWIKELSNLIGVELSRLEKKLMLGPMIFLLAEAI